MTQSTPGVLLEVAQWKKGGVKNGYIGIHKGTVGYRRVVETHCVLATMRHGQPRGAATMRTVAGWPAGATRKKEGGSNWLM